MLYRHPGANLDPAVSALDALRSALHAQYLREGSAADLELQIRRLARAEHALQLVAGTAQRAGQRGVAVALGPREDLDRRADRRQLDGGPGERRRVLDGAPQQRGAGEVGRQQRRDEVRATAVVLLGGVTRI